MTSTVAEYANKTRRGGGGEIKAVEPAKRKEEGKEKEMQVGASHQLR